MNTPHQIYIAIVTEMFCFAALVDDNNDTIYRNLSGHFPVRSYAGNQYIFIAYVHTINAILIKLMEGMDPGNMIAVFKEIYEELEVRNCKPKLHVFWTINVRKQWNHTSKKRR